MKIFAGGIATETNTFAATPTSLDDFAVNRHISAYSEACANVGFDPSEVWERMAAARADTFVLSLRAWAQPSGITLQTAYESLREEFLEGLRAALPVDVVLLALHGAMIAQGYDDCEEDLIRRVRELVGEEAIIGAEFDLHCHLSEATLAAIDLIITYKEYPHVDCKERAAELFELAVATKSRTITPTIAMFDCRMVGLYPTSREPMRGFVNDMMDVERRTDVLSVSFGHGFQFGDVPHVGAKVLVITDNNPALAKQIAAELGLRVYALRGQIGFDSLSLPMEQALSSALESKRVPVVVADQSDNPGGGAPGDATYALRWLLDHKASSVAMAIFYDPEVVRTAKKVGVGSHVKVRLGGKMGPSSGDPVDIDVIVHSIRREYLHSFPQAAGASLRFPIGDVVALRCGSIDIVVSSERSQCFCPSIFMDLGIDPSAKHLVIPKSAQHFYAAFAPIAGEVIYMAAKGAVVPDPRALLYRRLSTNEMYPWNDDPLGARGGENMTTSVIGSPISVGRRRTT